MIISDVIEKCFIAWSDDDGIEHDWMHFDNQGIIAIGRGTVPSSITSNSTVKSIDLNGRRVLPGWYHTDTISISVALSVWRPFFMMICSC
jgi:predicted amidohydrolase YtcJ